MADGGFKLRLCASKGYTLKPLPLGHLVLVLVKELSSEMGMTKSLPVFHPYQPEIMFKWTPFSIAELQRTEVAGVCLSGTALVLDALGPVFSH